MTRYQARKQTQKHAARNVMAAPEIEAMRLRRAAAEWIAATIVGAPVRQEVAALARLYDAAEKLTDARRGYIKGRG